MGNKTKKKNYNPGVSGPVLVLDQPSEAPVEAVEETPEKVVPLTPQVLVTAPSASAAPVKPRYCRITTFLSVVVSLPHDPYCVTAGKCFCEMGPNGRQGKTLHLIAGIPQIIPAAWCTHPQIRAMQTSGKILIKYLVG